MNPQMMGALACLVALLLTGFVVWAAMTRRMLEMARYACVAAFFGGVFGVLLVTGVAKPVPGGGGSDMIPAVAAGSVVDAQDLLEDLAEQAPTDLSQVPVPDPVDGKPPVMGSPSGQLFVGLDGQWRPCVAKPQTTSDAGKTGVSWDCSPQAVRPGSGPAPKSGEPQVEESTPSTPPMLSA